MGRFARPRRWVDVNSMSGAHSHPHSVPGVVGGEGLLLSHFLKVWTHSRRSGLGSRRLSGERSSVFVGFCTGSPPELIPHQVLPVRGLRRDPSGPDLPGALPVLGAQQGGAGALHGRAQGERRPLL